MTDPFTYAGATYQNAIRTANRRPGPVEGGAADPMPSPHHVPFNPLKDVPRPFLIVTAVQMVACALFLAGFWAVVERVFG